MKQGFLILETGDIFSGQMIGSSEETVGEVVFNTSMTGYQEIMTNPSNAGQIITFCYPMIGNYGINASDNESISSHLAGVVVGEICENPSHYRSNQSLSEALEQAGVAGLTGVDTRAVVKVIRKHGMVKGIVTDQLPNTRDNHCWKSKKYIPPSSPYWVNHVTTKEIKTYEHFGPHVVLVDFGYKKSILDALLGEHCQVTVVPYSTSYTKIQKLNPDGVVFSNGPGDPMAVQEHLVDYKQITESYPSLGIALGHQLIALAHGAQTAKLKYGHHGGNHPVKEIETGRVMITPQNHSYVVVEESIESTSLQITYHNVNDGSIEGLKHTVLPIQTVQFHPEAHPGPSDTDHIFDAFIEQIIHTGDVSYAVT